MRLAPRHLLSRTTLGAALVSALVAGLVVQASSGPAGAVHAAATPARDYLALGDSVTFGYREGDTTPPPNFARASSFTSYAEDVGEALGLTVANSACPGETSTSFTTAGVPSNGCENQPGGGFGYRTIFPLHVKYKGTQLAYALSYLKAHHHTALVTLMIGANDAFLCQETTADQCASELPAVLATLSTNVADILRAIRHTAHYRGQVVIVNYYSTSYANATDVAGSEALNTTVDAAAKPFDVQIANGFGAFEAAARQSGGDSCVAGLLTQLNGGGCGVHPSVAGQAVLALAVERVLKK